MQDFIKFLWDDAAMLSSSRAHWTLVPAAEANTSAQQNSDSIDATQNGKRHTYGLRIAYPEQAREICSKGLVVGSCAQADIRLESNQVHNLPLCVPTMTCRWQVSMGSVLHGTLKPKSLLWLLWSTQLACRQCHWLWKIRGAYCAGEGQARPCAAAG